MERILSVSYVPAANRHLPAIRIQGLWILKFGFSYKDKVRLVVDYGQITITKINDPASVKEVPKRYVQTNLYDWL